MLSIQIKAVNSNNGTKENIDGFTVYPLAKNVYKTKEKLKKEISTDGYLNWSGITRKGWVSKMRAKGYPIKIAIVAGSNEDCNPLV